MERIFSLRLDIKSPDLPFTVKQSICCESGDLIKVFANFQLELAKLLKQIAEEDHNEQMKLHGLGEDDDIPF